MVILKKKLFVAAVVALLAGSIDLGAMKRAVEPDHNPASELSQSYLMLKEIFTQAGNGPMSELVQHIMWLQFYSDPLAYVQKLDINLIVPIVQKLEKDMIVAIFTALEDESVLKMAFRLGYAKKYLENIPDDTLDCLHLINNLPKINMNTYVTQLYSQANLPRVLPLLESLRGEPLIELSLSLNHYSEIPEAISDLTSLEKLSLGHNKLTKLPDSIGSLKNLKVIFLDYNQITELPESFYTLRNLGNINLLGNPLTPETKQRVLEVFGRLVNCYGLRLD